jgi:hypothetical protein
MGQDLVGMGPALLRGCPDGRPYPEREPPCNRVQGPELAVAGVLGLVEPVLVVVVLAAVEIVEVDLPAGAAEQEGWHRPAMAGAPLPVA